MNSIFDKFPPEKKNQLLNWLMIAKPKDEWAEIVYRYIEHHDIKNWQRGLDFTIMWSRDPYEYAYMLARDGFAKPEWAMKTIENPKFAESPLIEPYTLTGGDQPWAAYLMVDNDGSGKPLAPPQWAMKVIENAETNNPCWEAHEMVLHGYAPASWARRVIENAKIGQPYHIAMAMVRNGYATQEWLDTTRFFGK